jgi:hypothetical protein
VTSAAATETSNAGIATSFGPLKQIDAGVLNVGTPKLAHPTAQL